MRYWKWTLAILFSLNVAFAADDKKPTKSESTKDEVKDAYDDPEFQKQLQEFSESDREILLPKFLIKTNMGDFIVELDMAHAGKTSENFIKYADEGYYEGTIFHRVIPGFMIQGGGFTPDLEKKRKGLHGPHPESIRQQPAETKKEPWRWLDCEIPTPQQASSLSTLVITSTSIIRARVAVDGDIPCSDV